MARNGPFGLREGDTIETPMGKLEVIDTSEYEATMKDIGTGEIMEFDKDLISRL